MAPERFARAWIVVAVLLGVLAVAVAVRFEIRRVRRRSAELRARRDARWQQRGGVLEIYTGKAPTSAGENPGKAPIMTVGIRDPFER